MPNAPKRGLQLSAKPLAYDVQARHWGGYLAMARPEQGGMALHLAAARAPHPKIVRFTIGCFDNN